MTDYEELSGRHSARYGEVFAEYLGHLSWTREQLEYHQTEQLRGARHTRPRRLVVAPRTDSLTSTSTR